ncbi:MAG: hypothetical protein Q7U50_08715 [Candidatus Nitrotoga sp.]|nr:hypothetical protein [Candidatus Nitrotoga sp.]
MRSEQVMILEGKEKGGNTATKEFFDVLNADFEPPVRWRSANITARPPVCTTGDKY